MICPVCCHSLILCSCHVISVTGKSFQIIVIADKQYCEMQQKQRKPSKNRLKRRPSRRIPKARRSS